MLPTKAKYPVEAAGFQPTRLGASAEVIGKTTHDLATSHKGLCSNCENLEQCGYPSTISETWFCGRVLVREAGRTDDIAGAQNSGEG